MDILYYSNYCKYSQKILQFITKNNLTDQLNFVCIDKRQKDPQNGQMYIVLENGNKVLLPPNIHSVPALLLVKKNYNVILGENISEYLSPRVKEKTNEATHFNGEPVGFSLNDNNYRSNVASEQYTFYNMSSEELSHRGSGGNRQLFNYVAASLDSGSIETPPDNYRPDKLSNNVTIDVIQQQRNAELQNNLYL